MNLNLLEIYYINHPDRLKINVMMISLKSLMIESPESLIFGRKDSVVEIRRPLRNKIKIENLWCYDYVTFKDQNTKESTNSQYKFSI